MKVLIFSTEFPPQIGGAGTYSYQLALSMNSHGHEVTVLTTKPKLNEEGLIIDTSLLKKGIHVIRKGWIRFLWIFYWTKFLAETLETKEFDFIYFANYYSIIIGAGLSNVGKYFVTLHGIDFRLFYGKYLNRKEQFRHEMVCSNRHVLSFLAKASSVIAVSQDLASDIAIFKPTFAVSVLQLAVDDCFFLKRKQSSIPDNIVVATGRLEKSKGFDTLIHAIQKVKKVVPDVELLIIGDGKYRTTLQALVKNLHMRDIVKFLGIRRGSELTKVYHKAKVFALPSQFKETFGLVYLEAMACGLPIIASNYGAVRDLVGHGENGFLVDPYDIEKLSMYIIDVLTSSKWKDFSDNSLEKASHYSTEEMGLAHLKLL